MEKDLGSSISSSYWREVLASKKKNRKRKYQYYSKDKQRRHLWLTIALQTPFKLMMVPVNLMLNSICGYFKVKKINETRTYIFWHTCENKEELQRKINSTLAGARISYSLFKNPRPFIYTVNELANELLNKGLYADMVPILEEAYQYCTSSSKDYLDITCSLKLKLAESYMRCGNLSKGTEIFDKILDARGEDDSDYYCFSRSVDFIYFAKVLFLLLRKHQEKANSSFNWDKYFHIIQVLLKYELSIIDWKSYIKLSVFYICLGLFFSSYIDPITNVKEAINSVRKIMTNREIRFNFQDYTWVLKELACLVNIVNDKEVTTCYDELLISIRRKVDSIGSKTYTG